MRLPFEKSRNAERVHRETRIELRRVVLLFVFLFVSLAAVDARAQQADRDDRRPGWFRLIVNQGLQGQPGGIGSAGGVETSFRIIDHLHADAGLKWGGIFPVGRIEYERQAYIGGLVGLAVSSGAKRTGWEGRTSVRAVRLHHADTDTWPRSFFANLIGRGAVDPAHGAEVVLSAIQSVPPGFPWGDLMFTIDARAGFFPTSSEMNWTATLALGAGFRLFQ